MTRLGSSFGWAYPRRVGRTCVLGMFVVVLGACGSTNASDTASKSKPEQPRAGLPSAELVFGRSRKYASRSDLIAMPADGSAERRLATEAANPSVSPNGQRIAFVRDDHIWVMRRDGSGQRRITKGMDPAWSHDGRTIFFSRFDSLLSVSADGQDVRRLTTAASDCDHVCCHLQPAPSPDGRILAFWDGGDCERGTGAIAAVTESGTPAEILERLHVGAAGYMFTFDFGWSPDGQLVAVAGDDYAGQRSGTFVSRRDGTRARRIAEPSQPGGIAWSPDGQWITLVPYAEGATDLWMVRADGSGLRRITRTPTYELDPAWLPSS